MRLRRRAWHALGRLDGFVNRLYGWRFNPLYHSGALAVTAFLVLLVTGVYLLFFYRIGSPWASVAGLQAQWWGGSWIRALHRYASDLTVVAVAVHALRMLLQGRSWGPRTLAWVSGLFLLGLVFVCGWTGLVMVWDEPALALAREGARLMDLAPVFAEPLERTFSGERPMPGAFFFLNLFAHIALPIGLAMLLWLHVARIARPALLPPRGLAWGVTGLLTALAVLWPAPLAPEADPLVVPDSVPLDLFYAFFVPLTRDVPAWVVWAAGTTAALVLVLVPLLARPREERRPASSRVDDRLCTGCRQCALDCPYEAITMVAREDGRAELVARVDPSLCVSCGICAGSCAPMGVGPEGRTGRDQLAAVRGFIAEHRPGARDVVVVGCDRGAVGARSPSEAVEGARVLPVSCAGSLHTSVIELLVRSGAGGVLVASCPPRDCWNREGPKWLERRVYHDREAELQARVDRRRVRLCWAGAGDGDVLRRAVASFEADVRELARREAEEDIVLDTECAREDDDVDRAVEVVS